MTPEELDAKLGGMSLEDIKKLVTEYRRNGFADLSPAILREYSLACIRKWGREGTEVTKRDFVTLICFGIFLGMKFQEQEAESGN